MPLYAYKCNDCEHEFEKRQRFSEEPLSVCPVCRGEVRRVINSVGIVFKGSGFYVTDNRSKSNGTTRAGNGNSGSADESGAETKPAESKSDSSETAPAPTVEKSTAATKD